MTEFDSRFDIPYIKLIFYTEMIEDTVMPQQKVSALRGGMGEMLLRQNCISDRKCSTCQFCEVCVVRNTIYSQMKKKPPYVTSEESVGYLIECDNYQSDFAQGEGFAFKLTLFGNAIVFFNQFLQAFCQLGMIGLGKHRARFRIVEVRNMEQRCILRRDVVDMAEYKISTVNEYRKERREKLSKRKGNYTLKFRTPLCMKYQEKFLDSFQMEAILKGVSRRIQMLDYYTGKELEQYVFCGYPDIVSQEVTMRSVERYSSTQSRKMTLRGITGQVVLKSVSSECLDFLLAGELLHVGKNTSFGFGKYQVLVM